MSTTALANRSGQCAKPEEDAFAISEENRLARSREALPTAPDGERRSRSEARRGVGSWLLIEADPQLELRAAWRLDKIEVERDAIAFWRRLDILPHGVEPEDRARDLAAVAYRDGKVIGVVTATAARLELLRARFAFVRCAVDPDFRHGPTASRLTVFAREVIERWSYLHPEEELAGIAGVVEVRDPSAQRSRPTWPNTGLNLVGYTAEGKQLRVAWFEHARVS